MDIDVEIGIYSYSYSNVVKDVDCFFLSNETLSKL